MMTSRQLALTAVVLGLLAPWGLLWRFRPRLQAWDPDHDGSIELAEAKTAAAANGG